MAYLSACEAVYLAVARDGGLTPRVQALVVAADDAWWGMDPRRAGMTLPGPASWGVPAMQWDEAYEYWERAVRVRSRDSRTWVTYGYYLRSWGRWCDPMAGYVALAEHRLRTAAAAAWAPTGPRRLAS
jgi:hypothetical protein